MDAGARRAEEPDDGPSQRKAPRLIRRDIAAGGALVALLAGYAAGAHQRRPEQTRMRMARASEYAEPVSADTMGDLNGDDQTDFVSLGAAYDNAQQQVHVLLSNPARSGDYKVLHLTIPRGYDVMDCVRLPENYLPDIFVGQGTLQGCTDPSASDDSRSSYEFFNGKDFNK